MDDLLKSEIPDLQSAPPPTPHLHAHAINILSGNVCGIELLITQIREMELAGPARYAPSFVQSTRDKIASLRHSIDVLLADNPTQETPT